MSSSARCRASGSSGWTRSPGTWARRRNCHHGSRAGLQYCVLSALDDGDCWVEYEDLLDRANTLLVMDTLDSRDVIERAT